MQTLKLFLLFIIVVTIFSLDSCLDKRYVMEPEPDDEGKYIVKRHKEGGIYLLDISEYVDIDTISYGDERFDHCDDLIDIVFGIKQDGTKVEIDTIQRQCESWHYENYDINDPRAKKILNEKIYRVNKKPEL